MEDRIKSIPELFESKSLVKICAPMVRYSRLPFRLLVREYNCDLAFSPMLLADSYAQSEKCRETTHSTNRDDWPLVVQFASNKPSNFADSAELIYDQAQGIDLNCGCPQTWAKKENIGACLIKQPELVSDILKQTRNRISDPDFTVSVKIRIFKDNIPKTVDLARQLEATGISFLSVHGRSIKERSEPVDLECIRAISDALRIPVIANGDINSLDKAYEVQEITGVKGVMCARSLLENPALFANEPITPLSAIIRWFEIDRDETMQNHFIFQHHLAKMMDKHLTNRQLKAFNVLPTRLECYNFLLDYFDLPPNLVKSDS